MRGLMLKLIAGLRWLLRALMTERPQVGRFEKLLRGALLVPIFGLMLILLRGWAALAPVRRFGGEWGPFRPLEVQAVTRGGLRFICRPHDFIQMYLYVFGIWEPDITAYLRRRLADISRGGEGGDERRSPLTFVDVGANIGYDTLIASRAISGRGKIVAIEASAPVHAELLRSINLNGVTNVRAIHKAVAARPGTLTVYAGPGHNTGRTTTVAGLGSGLGARRLRGGPQATVEAAPLGDLLEPHELASTRLIKIDVEGGEDAVLEGMLACLDRMPADLEIAIELSPLWWSESRAGRGPSTDGADDTDRAQLLVASVTSVPSMDCPARPTADCRPPRPIRKTAADVLAPFLARGFHVFTIPNNYWPWRYLWPNDVQRPRRLRDASLLTRPLKRLDIILSRQDSEEL